MSAPVVHALRFHYGDQAQIDFITLNKFKGVASLIAGIDTIHTIERVQVRFLEGCKISATIISLTFIQISDLDHLQDH